MNEKQQNEQHTKQRVLGKETFVPNINSRSQIISQNLVNKYYANELI
jgi:hypothetical protein